MGPAGVIVDSSAFLAILYGEPEGTEFMTRIAQSSEPKMSVANFLEDLPWSWTAPGIRSAAKSSSRC